MWYKNDPREHFDKRGTIVVSNGEFAFQAEVQTKYGWYVHVSDMMNGRTAISEDEAWPKEWYWAHLPGVRGPSADSVVVDEARELPDS